MKYVVIAGGLITGNFIFQFIGGHNWMQAADRSFFQAAAVLAVWVSNSKGAK